MSKFSTPRPGKGNSIIDFPSEYCMLDLETTGLSPKWDSIIEVGAIRYRDGVEVGRWHSLVQPPEGPYLDSFITMLTGITEEMLVDAPIVATVLPSLRDFLGDSIILGYNISFDINFLYEAFKQYLGIIFGNDHVDVRRLARKLHPEESSMTLGKIARLYNIERRNAHRAIGDCETTEAAYRAILREALATYGSYDGIRAAFKPPKRKHRRYSPKITASMITTDNTDFDVDCPIYGKHCVVTGKLEHFTRKEVMQLIADLGGINDNGVTKTTNFLILGNNDYCATIKDGKSSKQKKAEAAKLSGQDIEIIPENVFYDMIAEYVEESDA